MPLLSEPKIPTWLPSTIPNFATFATEDIPDEWRNYLGVG